MPKMKTRSSAKKRFKVTGSGRIKRQRAGCAHILTKKSPKRKRFLKTATTVGTADISRISRQLLIGSKV